MTLNVNDDVDDSYTIVYIISSPVSWLNQTYIIHFKLRPVLACRLSACISH